MGGWAFFGGFLAVGAGIFAIYQILRRKIRRFSSETFGNPDILKALQEIDTTADDTPRSLNGCDSLLLPQIKKDFPDFDETLVKTYARDALREKFGAKSGFQIYKVVIARYERSAAQKTVVLQAALSYQENGQKLQKRYDLHYAYLLPGSSETVAANCPNCGGALGYGETVCPYCGSRVAAVLGNTWKFTEMIES